jgi:cytochrome c oxidase accessory protein FixG
MDTATENLAATGAAAPRRRIAPRDRKAPLPPPRLTYHRVRKGVHLLCFLIFVALPFSNVLRFDIPRQRFHFFGYELWISEFGILFFTLMFLMFLIVVAAVLYGRIYCGYLCPQMIFSEASIQLEHRLRRLVNRAFPRSTPATRKLLMRASYFLWVGAASVFLAFVFVSYFVEPRDLLRRLLSFDLETAAGIAGATVTLITFLDFTLVRQRFCTTVCPYGYLQGMLTDGNTLLVQYRDPDRECIECKKCVRVCHMGIDIRTSPYQMECVHCGECIDACVDVLGRLGKRGLIHYAWGETGELLSEKSGPWYRRMGLRDPKRVVVLLVLLFYATGLFVALSMRHSVLVRIAPDRATLYRVADGGRIHNKFRLSLANRGSDGASVFLTVDGLPEPRLTLQPNPLPLEPGEQRQAEFEVSVARFPGAAEVNRFRIRTRTHPDETEQVFELTFLMPPDQRR